MFGDVNLIAGGAFLQGAVFKIFYLADQPLPQFTDGVMLRQIA